MTSGELELLDCLPEKLRAALPTFSRISAGLSGAGVFRVEAEGHAYVLKISNGSEPICDWTRKAQILKSAAAAGLAPRVVHIDEARQAVVSELVSDLSFRALWWNPATRPQAISMLGNTLRCVHNLPLPADVVASDPRKMLLGIWPELESFPLPSFVGNAVERMIEEETPKSDRPIVLSHNDVNPTNLIYDGEKLLLLDWDNAGPNDPYYDLAAIAVFMRMDDSTCLNLLASYDAKSAQMLDERFSYSRRLVAVLCGTVLLNLARLKGCAGVAKEELMENTLGLAEFYQRLQVSAINVGSAEGQLLFGLALLKESLSL